MSGFLSGRTSLTTVQTGDIAADAVTLAKMVAGTDGVIITYDASGNPVHVGPGSDGEVLTSTGAGSPPAFEAAGSGAWSVKTSGTASGVSALTISGLTTKHAKIILTNLNGSGGDYAFTMSNDDASTFLSSNYYSTRVRLHAGDQFQLTSQVAWLTGTTTGDQSADDGYWEIDVPNPGSTACEAWITWRLWQNDASTTSPDIVYGTGGNAATGDIDAIKIAPASGTFSCTYTVLELN
jgi:hypothetical protein